MRRGTRKATTRAEATMRHCGTALATNNVCGSARHRAGSKLADTEVRAGSVPEVRELAQQLLADQQDQIAKLTTGRRARSKA
jgi:Domain of unknown function (DUF305)